MLTHRYNAFYDEAMIRKCCDKDLTQLRLSEHI